MLAWPWPLLLLTCGEVLTLDTRSQAAESDGCGTANSTTSDGPNRTAFKPLTVPARAVVPHLDPQRSTHVLGWTKPLPVRLELVDRERRRQVTVGVDLIEQLVGLPLDGLDRVGARNPAQRRLLLVDEGDQSLREFRGVAALLATHRLPGGPSLRGPFGVVLDRQLGVGG